jgi:hypothetical protein
MAYGSSGPAGRPAKNELIIGVGSRAYVNWSPAAGEIQRPVPMTDGAGNQISNDLVDGQEVEILSWRPRSRAGLTYQVRRLSDGSDWWIAARYLRRRSTRNAEPAAAEQAPTPAAPSRR